MLKLMLWHSENISQDGFVTHPCDSKAWKYIHEKYPTFATKPRNFHLGLVADGVNPFKLTWSNWSTWPVMLLNYNLPPQLTTNKLFIMLALLISRKEFVTRENFDVYLCPLVDELKKLWARVLSYDV
jgi:hypothetical protein